LAVFSTGVKFASVGEEVRSRKAVYLMNMV
jgi:hypothetical protein